MKLHSNIFGEGIPFIVLHGFLGMGDNWKTLAKKISEQGYQMLLIDQRNHGRSPHSDDFSYELMASDLLEYCNDHHLKDVILLGHSMGGKTAMLFAVNHPEVIRKLIIADIGPKYYPLHHQDILDGLSSLDFDVLKSRSEVDTALGEYVKDPGVRMFLMKNLFWEEKGRLGLRMNLESLVQNSSEIGVELADNYKYTGDTLFMKGDKSNYILEDDEHRIKSQFPLAQIREISNSGHWLHAENPTEFYSILLEFIKN